MVCWVCALHTINICMIRKNPLNIPRYFFFTYPKNSLGTQKLVGSSHRVVGVFIVFEHLRRPDTLGRFSAILTRETTFSDVLSGLLSVRVRAFWKGVYSEGKEFAPFVLESACQVSSEMRSACFCFFFFCFFFLFINTQGQILSRLTLHTAMSLIQVYPWLDNYVTRLTGPHQAKKVLSNMRKILILHSFIL